MFIFSTCQHNRMINYNIVDSKKNGLDIRNVRKIEQRPLEDHRTPWLCVCVLIRALNSRATHARHGLQLHAAHAYCHCSDVISRRRSEWLLLTRRGQRPANRKYVDRIVRGGCIHYIKSTNWNTRRRRGEVGPPRFRSRRRNRCY